MANFTDKAIINSSIELSDEDLRIVANVEQFYDALLAAMRELRGLPDAMTWKQVHGAEYLYEWRHGHGQPKSRGRRSPETESILADFTQAKRTAEERAGSIGARMSSALAQYRALRLPQIMALPARILRELDLRGHLGTNLMVVGTNAFAAYEIEARERFAHGLDETEDFDLGWCRGSGIAFMGLQEQQSVEVSPLFAALRAVDGSFKINAARPYQAVNQNGYAVELLTAPSVMRTLSKHEVFRTAAIPEQEWLLKGKPIRHVICARDGSAVPLFVPDPRWMGLHKLWLARKPERNPLKKDKDARQGELLLSAVARKMSLSHPMDTEFLLGLPDELMDVFNPWAATHRFVPPNQRVPDWW